MDTKREKGLQYSGRRKIKKKDLGYNKMGRIRRAGNDRRPEKEDDPRAKRTRERKQKHQRSRL
jgi:hypothetical protein